jgi:transposase
LDISKARLDYAIEGGAPLAVPNTVTGIAKLLAHLQPLPGVRLVCEASGGYERALLARARKAGLPYCRVPAGRVRYFARAEGMLAKSDRIDVGVIYRYARSMNPRVEPPLSEELVGLRDLLDYRRQLLEQRTQTINRLETAGPTLRGLLERQRERLVAEVKEADVMIQAHLRHCPALQAKLERLQQLQGVGPILATTLLAYLPELGQEDDKRIASLVGVAPYPDESGMRSGPRHVQGGRAEVRHVLYMAAVAATQHNPVLRAFYERLLATGKPPKVCLTAVMRKMITVLNRLLRDPHFTLAN